MFTTKMTSNSSVRNSSAVLHQLNDNMTVTVLPVTIMIGLEAVIGFVGNILILTIYSKRQRSNFKYFVLFMAIMDLTSCLTTMPGEIFSQMNWYKYEYEWICKGKSYFNVLTAWGSASILLLLALDRHRKICHTLEWQIQPSCALKLCILAIAISALVSIPITILWGKQNYIYLHDGITLQVTICEKSSQFADGIYPFIYIVLIYILPVGLMMVIVVYVNILTGRILFGGMNCTTSLQPGLSKAVSVSTLKRVSIDSETRLKTINSEMSDLGQHEVTSFINGDHPWCHNLEKYQSDAQPVDTPIQEESEFTGVGVNGHDCFAHNGNTERNGTSSEIGIHTNDPSHKRRVKYHRKKYKRCSETVKLKPETSPVVSLKSSAASSSTEYIRRFDIHTFRRKRKTLIMLILTSIFVTTMTVYVILTALVAEAHGILRDLSNDQKVVFFFFWRLYFINCVINPILYGLMDPRFRSGLKLVLKLK